MSLTLVHRLGERPHARWHRGVLVAAGLSALLLALLVASSAGAFGVATVVPPDGLNLRAGPGTDTPIIMLIPGAARVALTGGKTESGWYPATYQERRGFVRAEFLDLPADAAQTSRRATVRAADGVVLRDLPAPGGELVTVAAPTTLLTVGARPTSDGWLLAAHAGFTGWLRVEAVTVEEGSPPSAPAVAPTGPRLTAPTPVSSPAATAGAGAVRATITYYHPSLEGGRMACGGIYRSEDTSIAAATSWPCGTQLRVCRNAACVTVTVQDTGLMGPHWVDLSASAFRQLGSLPEGMIFGTVEVLAGPGGRAP